MGNEGEEEKTGGANTIMKKIIQLLNTQLLNLLLRLIVSQQGKHVIR